MTVTATSELKRRQAEAKQLTAPAVPEEKLPDNLPDLRQNGAYTRPLPTFTIHALIDDFPFDVSFTGSAEQLAATVRRLRELGAVPPSPQARAAIEAEKERSAPVCSCDACDKYGKPMRESTRAPGTYYCSGKVGMKAGQPVYCREKA